MNLSKKQKIVIDYARQNGGEITKKQAMSLIDTSYCNGQKYVGEVLSRMVKAGLLIRVSPGFFRLGKGSKSKPVPQADDNQIGIFSPQNINTMPKSQNTKIKMHLIFRGSITPIEALNLYGCFRLAARIKDLRDHGFPVESKLVKDMYSGKKYAEYSLMKKQA